MRVWTVVLIFAGLVLGLHVWGYLDAGSGMWGFHHYRMFPVVWMLAGAGILIAAVAIGSRAGAPRMRAMTATLLASAVGGVLFWIARSRFHLLGDGESRIESLRQARFVWHLEPGGILIPHYLNRALGGDAPGLVFAGLSAAAGVGFLLLAGWFAREVGGGRGILVFGILAAAGTAKLFFGYVETYPLLAVIVALYAVLAGRYVRGRSGPLGMSLALLAALLIHIVSILLLPSFVYAVLRGRAGEGSPVSRRLPWLLVPVAALVLLQVLVSRSGVSLAHVFAVFSDGLLPIGSAAFPYEPYSLFAPGHILDLIQLEILLGPFGGVLAVLVLLLGGRRWLGRDGAVLLAAAVPWWLFTLTFYPSLGLPRQWGLFAPGSILSLMLLALMLARVPLPKPRPRWIQVAGAVLVGLSLFHTIPWVAISLDPDRGLAHVAGIYGPGSRQSAFARSSTYDAIGTWFLSHGQPDNAELAYKEAVNADTTNAYAAGHLGSMFLFAGRNREAARLLAWAVEKDPGQEYLLYELGNAYNELQQPDSAAVYFRKALDLNPRFRQAGLNLAVLERRAGRLEETRRILTDLQRQYPDDYQVLSNLGMLARADRDTLKALDYLQQALDRNPQDADTAYNLALLLMQRNRLPEAMAHLNMVVDRKPRDVEAWINLGAVRLLLERNEEAMFAFQNALLVDPSRPEPYFNLFRMLLAREDTVQAVATMQAYAARDSTTRFGMMARRILDELGAGP